MTHPCRPGTFQARVLANTRLADRTWREMLQHSPVWGTFLGIEVDDGALDDTSDAARLRDRAKSAFEAREGVKLSFLPFYAVAVCEALKQHHCQYY